MTGKLPVLFKKFLYIGKKNYLIHRNGKIEVVKPDYREKNRLVILAKKYYFETLKSFPFSGIKEIKSAIAMDITAYSPFQTDSFFVKKIGQTDENTRVNIWFINNRIGNLLKDLSPLVVIPETALLSFLDEPVPMIYTIHNKDDENFLVCIGPERAVKSIISRQMDIESFKRIIGAGARDYPVRKILRFEEYLALFPGILYSLSLRNLSGFVNSDAFFLKINKVQLIMGLAATGLLFFLYTGLSGLLPYYVNKKLQKEDQALSIGLSGFLKTRELVDVYHQKQKELAEIINKYPYKLSLMNLLNTTLPEDTVIRQLTISGNIVEIKGVVPGASVLLEALSQANGIKNAKFTSPLRKDRKTGLEFFTLTFIYKPEYENRY